MGLVGRLDWVDGSEKMKLGMDLEINLAIESGEIEFFIDIEMGD